MMAFDPNGPPPRIEVVTAVQRRRRFSTAEKVRLVEESMQPGMSVSLVAGQAGIAPACCSTGGVGCWRVASGGRAGGRPDPCP